MFFQLENDAENWMYFKTYGGNIILKKDAIPKIVKIRKSGSQLSESAREM